jgi:hypothetical protein
MPPATQRGKVDSPISRWGRHDVIDKGVGAFACAIAQFR